MSEARVRRDGDVLVFDGRLDRAAVAPALARGAAAARGRAPGSTCAAWKRSTAPAWRCWPSSPRAGGLRSATARPPGLPNSARPTGCAGSLAFRRMAAREPAASPAPPGLHCPHAPSRHCWRPGCPPCLVAAAAACARSRRPRPPVAATSTRPPRPAAAARRPASRRPRARRGLSRRLPRRRRPPTSRSPRRRPSTRPGATSDAGRTISTTLYGDATTRSPTHPAGAGGALQATIRGSRYNRRVHALQQRRRPPHRHAAGAGLRRGGAAPGAAGVSNFFSNLGQPATAVNALLQGKPRKAAQSLGRFVVNSTLGVAGVFDPATDAQPDQPNEDFGQTLGVWGWKRSRYVELPLFGPRTVRDVFGLVGDAPLSPMRQVERDLMRVLPAGPAAGRPAHAAVRRSTAARRRARTNTRCSATRGCSAATTRSSATGRSADDVAARRTCSDDTGNPERPGRRHADRFPAAAAEPEPIAVRARRLRRRRSLRHPATGRGRCRCRRAAPVRPRHPWSPPCAGAARSCGSCGWPRRCCGRRW